MAESSPYAGREVPLRALGFSVGGVPELNQTDGIHPTAEGHRRMAENAWTTLDSIFRVAAERQSRGQP